MQSELDSIDHTTGKAGQIAPPSKDLAVGVLSPGYPQRGQIDSTNSRPMDPVHDSEGQSSPKRIKLEPPSKLALGVVVHRGKANKRQSPSPSRPPSRTPTPSSPRPSQNTNKTTKKNMKAAARRGALMDQNYDLRFSGKYTVTLDTGRELQPFLSRNPAYFPFDPDHNYAFPSGVPCETSPVGQGMTSRRDKMPDTNDKMHLHWYIALNQPSELGCPLEASPEAWDPREHRLIPIGDVLDPSSGFHNKAQRDMLAKFYLLMYYRNAVTHGNPINAANVLGRLGMERIGLQFTPLTLVCTFCGQYSDIGWHHIELYDRDALSELYFDSIANNPKTIKPMHIGILSVLTCNHIDCKNASRSGLPPRRASGARRDEDDFYCQLFTLKVVKGQHKKEMMKIIADPQCCFPSTVAGNEERLKWQKLDIDDLTVRYIRMEAYVNTILREYWSKCRVCGGDAKHAQATNSSGTTSQKFAQKGVICTGSGECYWSDAIEMTGSEMETQLGTGWAMKVSRDRELRRGAPPAPRLLPTRQSFISLQSPNQDFSYDSDRADHGSNSSDDIDKLGFWSSPDGERTDPMEIDDCKDEPNAYAQAVGGAWNLDLEPEKDNDAQDQPMFIEDDLIVDYFEHTDINGNKIYWEKYE